MKHLRKGFWNSLISLQQLKTHEVHTISSYSAISNVRSRVAYGETIVQLSNFLLVENRLIPVQNLSSPNTQLDYHKVLPPSV